METLKGVGISNGIAIGKALVILDEETVIVEEPIESDRVEEEVTRFHQALKTAQDQIRKIKEQVQGRIGDEHAFIFDTHILLLQDPSLKSESVKYIRNHSCNAEWAFSRILIDVLKQFSTLGDSYFVERGNDLKDVGKRVLRILVGNRKKEFAFSNLNYDAIVVGGEFGPSNITHFDKSRIVGFATDFGGQTTHTAIIAKALDLPAVLGLHDVTKRVRSNDNLILDSFSGKVIVNPDQETLEKYRKLMRVFQEETAAYRRELRLPTASKDGRKVTLLANIELPNEVEGALRNGAAGIGLYRTEFLFLSCDPELPSEDIHFQTYCEMAAKLEGRPVTIRTFDLGGEKFFNRTFVREKETNPVMGLRGVRLCLKRRDIFRTQLRALLRAAHQYPNIRIMFPLISGLSEWRETRAFLETVKSELRAEGQPFAEDTPIGVMIEVPSAAMVADFLAKEVSFFSIGTNDLIQYFMAIDRANDDVSYLYDPLHPGVLRMLKLVIDAAHQAGIEVSCCGEMAASPLYASVLVQLGMTQLSMNPASLPVIHHIIRALDFSELDKEGPKPCGNITGRANHDAYMVAFKKILEKKDYDHFMSGEIANDG